MAAKKRARILPMGRGRISPPSGEKSPRKQPRLDKRERDFKADIVNVGVKFKQVTGHRMDFSPALIITNDHLKKHNLVGTKRAADLHNWGIVTLQGKGAA